MNNILIVLLGPTGVGKTDISIDLASRFNSEIISADSRQFFTEMKIGTAAPTDFHLAKIKHHFIRFISVKDYYSASLFERDVITILSKLFSRNNIVLMTGGSGLYIDAVCNGIDDIPDIDPASRQKFISMYSTEGIDGLRRSLLIADPDHYRKVDLNNPKRIMRALEIYDSTGIPYSAFLKKTRRERDFKIIKIGLERERDELYSRINSRVNDMINAGLEEEARSLYGYRDLNALNTVGYREFFDYFEEKITKDKAIELIKRNSRRYAKRQITWWSKDSSIKWFNADESDNIVRYISEAVNEPGL